MYLQDANPSQPWYGSQVPPTNAHYTDELSRACDGYLVVMIYFRPDANPSHPVMSSRDVKSLEKNAQEVGRSYLHDKGPR